MGGKRRRDSRKPPGNRYLRCLSSRGETLALGEVFRPANAPRQPHEWFGRAAGFGFFQLIANNLSLRHACFGGGFFQPESEIFAKTNCKRLTHTTKAYSKELHISS